MLDGVGQKWILNLDGPRCRLLDIAGLLHFNDERMDFVMSAVIRLDVPCLMSFMILGAFPASDLLRLKNANEKSERISDVGGKPQVQSMSLISKKLNLVAYNAVRSTLGGSNESKDTVFWQTLGNRQYS